MLRQYAKERQIHLWKQQFIITSSGLIRQMQHNAVYKLIALLQSQMCSQQLMATKQFIAPWLGAQPSMFVNRETKQNPISDATINHQLLPRQSSTHPHTPQRRWASVMMEEGIQRFPLKSQNEWSIQKLVGRDLQKNKDVSPVLS